MLSRPSFNLLFDWYILADQGVEKACRENPALALGVNVFDGLCTYKHVADDLNLEYTPRQKVLA
ncbi:MAG: hypothetical protein AMJ79_09525 [Phycisphaerae bacterium SM23_30]|nr:MAG: hypothetical protein AMJ79_09525 [Phycisphaerae bacterium SM23_30]